MAVNNDPMISQMPTVQPAPSALPPIQPQPKQPGKFSRIFGGLVGGALNIVAPGAGSLIGGFINGGAGGVDFNNMQAMLTQQAQQSMQMLAIQNRVQSQSQEFTTVSNLMRAKHEGDMSAVQNFKA
jgi:predicted lipid-binding transport protein (Tim44 family)